MKLRQVAKIPICIGKNCPTVYASDRGTLVIQGARVSDAVDVDVPGHEVLAEVPIELIRSLINSGEL